MITNLELPFVVVFVYESVMWSVIAERIEKEDPVLFMHWSPSEYLLNGTTYNRVSFPDYTPECYANRVYEAVGSIDCDFPPNFMQKSAWADTATEVPSAKELVSRLSFTDLEMNTMTIDLLRRQRTNPSPSDQWKTACKWLRNSTSEFSSLSPPLLAFSHSPLGSPLDAGSWTPWIPVPREPERTNIPTWEIAVILTIAAICILLELLAGVLVFSFRKRTIIKFG
jgi:hypothetical protein